MTIQVDFGQLVGLLIAFLGFVFAAGKVLLGQIDRRLTDRFAAMEKARVESTKHWDDRFATLESQSRADAANWLKLERDFLKFLAELPLQYVRREDYVRNQTVLEAKLDAVGAKIDKLNGVRP